MPQPSRRDIFAEIAGRLERSSQPQPLSRRREALAEPEPPLLPELFLPTGVSDPGAAFTPAPRPDTAEKLAAALEEYRRRYEPFTLDLAPGFENTRITRPLAEFDWRVQTAADLADFGSALAGNGAWERVRIPHYGGPLGRATTLYRTTFGVTPEMSARGTLWLCFKGVDYRADVFVNGAYIGSHEGFFAPFELACTEVAHAGENTLLVQVHNDAICMGNASWGTDGHLYDGDKIYAATGPGWDDPEIGWHHCPPGMGIYQDVYLEARPPVFIGDIFVRPLLEDSAAEGWIEVYNSGRLRRSVGIELSLFGQNFPETVFVDQPYDLAGAAGPTVNYYRLPFEIPAPRAWDTETPWLYQLQVRLSDEAGHTLDRQARQFGMRSFHMDEFSEPKGRFYLNGHEIRLRGANTMGHEQQCVIKQDPAQLRDDILLAKLCHMNYLRLTQRPVQDEVYALCDRLGLMTQTDLPLFGVLRRNQFGEAVRQAGEMERLARSHPCNIMVTYINEPFPEGQGKLHRQLARPELESFFVAADQAVRLANPDRVIKAVDGDYDPPGPGLPDNHCYCGWYNGHGVDLGRLHKGYWQKVKPGWRYGCGEFGAEGLDPLNVMHKHYPTEWLPQTPERERDWTPDQIVKAQTGRFHYMWFDRQHSVAGWIAASQAHQAWATRLMTEAMRRDSRMSSFAIHLFVDAFPSGWMKAIMDVERQPKPAYFAYREALTPLMVSLRTDRFTFWSGEAMVMEAWVCNDRDTVVEGAGLHYQVEQAGQILFSQRSPATVPRCDSLFQGYLSLAAPQVETRSSLTVRLALVGAGGEMLHDSAVTVDVFARPHEVHRPVHIIGGQEGPAARLARELGLAAVVGLPSGEADQALILVDDYAAFAAQEAAVLQAVAEGATAAFLELPPGQYRLPGDEVIEVAPCGMNPRHFVSRATGHPLVADFAPADFRFWYDEAAGYVTPLLVTTFSAASGAAGWSPILTSGNGDWSSGWGPALAAAERKHGRGTLRICQVALAGRAQAVPVARIFAGRLLGLA